MQTVRLIVFTIIAAAAAHADFSYITVTKTPGGETTSKHYIKGQKLITDNGTTLTIMDLDAQAVTTVNKLQKTYSVKSFSDMYGKSAPAAMNTNVDIKKTGQTKNINGFDAEEMVVTMTMAINNQARQPGTNGPSPQMQVEAHFWIASGVPGVDELQAFYAKNAERMPWVGMAQGSASMAEVQRKLAAMHGVTVRTVIKTGSSDPQMQANLEKLRAQIEAMKKQGGPQAAQADQLLARIGGGSNDITSDSSGFSGAPVSDSVYTIPPDYRKMDQ